MPDGTDYPGRCVGLFGSCGGSTWRDPYRQWCDAQDVLWFDPQIMPETHGRNWCEADIENEVKHLVADPILIFRVTGETTGLMSCLEIVKIIQNPSQFIVVQIDDLNADHEQFSLDEPRMQSLRQMLEEQGMKVDNPIRDADRARAWAKKAVADCPSPLVRLVDSDDEAMRLGNAAMHWLAVSNIPLQA